MSQPCNSIPTINNGNNFFTICQGSPITLTTEMPSWLTDISYVWESGETSESIMVLPDSSTTYSVSVTYTNDTFFCANSASIEVIVFDSIALSITDDLEVCAQDQVSLEVSGGTSYLWSTGDTTSTVAITAETNQLYNVTVTDSNDCSATDFVQVFVNPLSDTTYLLLTSCDSSTVGTIVHVYPDQNECDSIVIENTTLILSPAMPIAPADIMIMENEPPFQISIAEVPNATTYFWTVPAGVQILSGAGTNSITIYWGELTTGGSICVTATNECGSSPSDCMEVAVDIMDRVNNLEGRGYSIFPNPADEFFNIIFENGESFEILLLDVLGREVLEPITYLGKAQFATRDLAAGTYWLKISRNGKLFWERIEILR